MSGPIREPYNGPSRDGPVQYAPKKSRPPEPDANPAGVPAKGDAGPRSAALESADPPWKRPKQRAPFVGDVAAGELRTRLALMPDRLPEPPPPPSISPKFVLASRLAGLAAVMAVGVIGYQLYSASPVSLPHPALPSGQSNQQGLESKPLAAYPPQSAPGESASPTAARTIQPQSNERRSRDTALPRAAAWSSKPAPATSLPRQHPAADQMMKTGADFIARGDFPAARLIYRRLAEEGEATAAFALAETYDPLVLRTLNVSTAITPDVMLAQRWYEKANDLGSAAAPERLQRLSRLVP